MSDGDAETRIPLRGRWLPPLALALLQAATSIWLIVTATAPARDGARYFRYALRLEHEPWLQVVRSSFDHPGYPFLIHATLRLAGRLGVDDPASRVILVQCVAALCGLLFVLLAFHVMRRLCGGTAAWLGCAALVVLPGPASCMADILSDAPHALLWLAAAAILLRAWRTARAVWFAAAGLAAGAAYWLRVDALSLPVAALATMGLCLARGGRRILPGAAAFVVGFGALFALFCFTVGKWSPKPSAEDLLLGVRESLAAPPAGLADVSLSLTVTPIPTAAWRALVEFAEETRTIHLVSFGLAAAWALRRRAWGIEMALFAMALLACWLAASALEARSGYVSGRYFLPLLPFVACAGMSFWVELDRRRRRPVLAPIAFGLALLVSVPALLREGMHPGAHGQMEAGRWLAHRLRGEGTVHDPFFFPTYVAGIGDRAVPGIAPPPGSRVHFVIADKRLEARSEDLRRLLTGGQAQRVATFPRRAGAADGEIAVYRCAGSD